MSDPKDPGIAKFGGPEIVRKPRNLYVEHMDAMEAENRVRPVCEGCQRVYQSDGQGRARIATKLRGVSGRWHWSCYQKVTGGRR